MKSNKTAAVDLVEKIKAFELDPYDKSSIEDIEDIVKGLS
jgi:hypothetical protein